MAQDKAVKPIPLEKLTIEVAEDSSSKVRWLGSIYKARQARRHVYSTYKMLKEHVVRDQYLLQSQESTPADSEDNLTSESYAD